MKKRILIALAALIGLGYGSYVFAQALTTADVCATYQHNWVNIPVATPTQQLVAGVAGTSIYVCAVHFAQTAATPALTLSYGEMGAATPCATTSPGAIIGLYGAGNTGTTKDVGSGSYSLAIVPSGASTPAPSLCSLWGVPAQGGGGSVEYVQK